MKKNSSKKQWQLIRQDESGNKYIVDSFRTKEKAEQEMENFQKKGHKQTYWIQKE